MSFERVVVSAEELTQLKPVAEAPPHAAGGQPFGNQTFEMLPSPIPWWARVGMSLLVPVLPLLALLTIVLRVAFRDQTRNIRFAWVSFMSTLLVISGLLTFTGAILVFSFMPIPAIVNNNGLPDLDERQKFAALPSADVLSSSDISAQLKPLVVIISPAARLWNHQEVASNEFGAGALLSANKAGYLFATANHVVNHTVRGSGATRVMIATASGIWSTGHVVAVAKDLDLALVWVARNSGSGDFIQPVASPKDGAPIFVIGHPEGLKFTLSTGIISGLRDEIVQVSAAISPGNSGGPVYDDRGQLIGIVSSKFDQNIDANAENIGFATRADTLSDTQKWTFLDDGKKLLETYIAAVKTHHDAPQAPQQNNQRTPMAYINVTVYDSTENKRVPAELPDDAPCNKIVAVLIQKLQLPTNGPDGAPLSYKFHHKNSGRQVQDSQTLAEAGVKDGDILRLQPEITAG